MPTLAVLLLQTENDHRVVQGERGCSKSKRTAGYMLVSLRSQAKLARCGDRYDPQLIKRSIGVDSRYFSAIISACYDSHR